MTYEQAPKKVLENRPGQRLITLNLLASAALFESQETVNWATIEDLSALIDLFCLYDRAIVIGHKNDKLQSVPQSGLFDLLKDFINFRPPEEEIEVEVFRGTASQHLAAFLGDEEDPDRFGRVFNIVFRSARYNWAVTPPDTPDDIEIGKEWFLTTPTHADLVKLLEGESEDAYRGTAFLVRTFLYLAYSDVHKIVFTPDIARSSALKPIAIKEEQFRGKLLQHIKGSFVDSTFVGKIHERVAPFAIVIFTRANGDKRKIPEEMAKLREELAPFRRRLRDIEDKALWRSYDDAVAAKTQWEKALAEIKRDFSEPTFNYALSEIMVDKLISFAKSGIIDPIGNPLNPSAWLKAINGLTAEVIIPMLRQGPVIEIHRLRHHQHLPGPKKLEELISNLFGEVRET